MLKSMTGYGRAQFADAGLKITVEIKSVNHRFLEAFVKMPRKYCILDERMKEVLRTRLNRGKVDVWVGIEELSGESGLVKVDKNLAIDYYKTLRELAEFAEIPQEISIYELSSMEGVMTLQEQEKDLEELWVKINEAFLEALAQLVEMREAEGKRLEEDLLNRMAILKNIVGEIGGRAPEINEAYRTRLNERITALAGDIDVDPNRLATEIAIFAEKSDITEEVVRFKSHLVQLEESIKSGEPVGRKMDFLMQELNREINTMGSKSPDLILSQKVVEAKSEIEKMREQIQNVE